MEEQLPRKFGKYTLLRKIAVGGMAEIFLALHRSISGFEKLLVIKRILPNLTEDEEFLRMFLDEARIAATLNHPNIAQIYDVGSANEQYFIAMEYVHGEDLRSIVRGMKKKNLNFFPLEHSLQIIASVCAGLEYAHTRTDLQGRALEIVHRDISPQNVLVTFTGDIKIVDFGIARAKLAGADPITEERGQLKGKVPYMSPEQGKGKELDRRSDIFSVGILLFELTTGRRLFRGTTEFNTLRMIVEEDYPRPTQFREHYPPDLETLVMRALARDRDDRYSTAQELQADLEEFIRHHRIPASTLNLAKFLSEIFEEKLAAQGEALAEGKRLADIIAEEESRAQELPSEDLVELGADGQPISRDTIPAQTGPSTASWVEAKKSSGAGRLALALVALVAILGISGGVFFFATRGETTTVDPDVFGRIEVVTSPEGASVALDGESTQFMTPYTFEKLRAGRTYQLKLSLDGYRPELREVKLSASHPNERIALELRPTSTGIVVVQTTPQGAKVYIDGRLHSDVSPTTIPEISPNETHTILVKLAGFRDAIDTASVQPGKILRLNFELEVAPLGLNESWLLIESEPVGAKITLDGTEIPERTPFKRRLTADKTVAVELNKSGFKAYRKSVKLVGGETIKVAASLDRARRGGGGGDPGGTGRLYFDAVPFCNVSIDGRSYGPTPVVGVELPAGRRRVRCSSPPIGVTKTFTVNVPTNGTVRRRVKLTP